MKRVFIVVLIVLAVLLFLSGCSWVKKAPNGTEISATASSISEIIETTALPIPEIMTTVSSIHEITATTSAETADSIAETATTAPTMTVSAMTEPVTTAASSLKIELDDYPLVDGSTATIPLSTAMMQMVTGVDMKTAERMTQHTKTSAAFYALVYGRTDLLLVYSPSESTAADIEDIGIELEMKPIGRDALVFLANKDNPVQSLTTEQIIAIYTDKIRNWKEVGGADLPIAAFQRNETSGSQALMQKLVMKDREMAEAPKAMVKGEMGMLIEGIAEYTNTKNALGYSVYYYVKNMFAHEEVQTVAVNGIPCTNETIKDGTYPFTDDFYAVIRKSEPVDSSARKLFNWITGAEGKLLIEATGYTAVDD